MKIFHLLRFATIFSIRFCLAQVDFPSAVPADVQSMANSIVQTAAAVQSQFDPSTTLPPTSDDDDDDDDDDDETTTSSSQTSPTTTTSPSPSPSATTSTSTSSSSKTSTAKPASSTTSTAKPASSTTSTARPSSSTASSGLGTSAKIGIGVGLPFGLIALAGIGFLILRHLRYKKDSRLRHHGILAAGGLYPVVDEVDTAGGRDERNMIHAENGEAQEFEKDGIHEIQGTGIPPYSIEAVGSPGVPRQELPTGHGFA